jgi:hypothetical protein
MAIFVFLKTLLDLRKICSLFLECGAFLKKNKLLPFVALLPIIFFVIYYLTNILLLSNAAFLDEIKRIEVLEIAKEGLGVCGDKTAISISIISTGKDGVHRDITDPKNRSTAKWRWGVFHIAQACDDRQKASGRDCIIDLKDHNTDYNKIYDIDVLSYEELVKLAGLSIPSRIKLNKDGVQDLENLRFLPTLKGLIEMTDWAKEGIVKNLWITATANLTKLPSGDADVLYVFTFLTGKDHTGCDTEIPRILMNLKDKMGIPKWL